MSATADLTRSEETSWSVLSPDIILPVQFADHDTNQGEKRLMLAVLEEAVATFQRNTHAKTRRGQRLFREAEEWIQSEDVSWTYAFENVCHTLGLDPEYLRGGLERLKERRPVGGARVYRFRRVSGRRTSVVPTRARERAAEHEQKRAS
jgi:hypothetical protein